MGLMETARQRKTPLVSLSIIIFLTLIRILCGPAYWIPEDKTLGFVMFLWGVLNYDFMELVLS